jgi:hypothetical protein
VGHVAVRWNPKFTAYELEWTHQDCWQRFAGVMNEEDEAQVENRDGNNLLGDGNCGLANEVGRFRLPLSDPC